MLTLAATSTAPCSHQWRAPQDAHIGSHFHNTMLTTVAGTAACSHWQPLPQHQVTTVADTTVCSHWSSRGGSSLKHVAFDGQLLHGVPHEYAAEYGAEKRISFLVNIWIGHKPNAATVRCCSLTVCHCTLSHCVFVVLCSLPLCLCGAVLSPAVSLWCCALSYCVFVVLCSLLLSLCGVLHAGVSICCVLVYRCLPTSLPPG